MKRHSRLLLFVAAALSVVAVGGCGSRQPSAGDTNGNASTTPTTTPGGHKVLSLVALSDVAPGLGTVMIEVGHRNWILYYAAKQGNWDLAAYQAKELGEALDVGEATRPARKPGLQDFAQNALAPLNAAITAKDSAKFMLAWDSEVSACNRCHFSEKFPYIVWKLPKTPPENLTLTPVP